MAQATAEKQSQQQRSQPPRNPYAPVSWEEYEREKAERAERRRKRQAELRRCLNWEYAAQSEARKPKYEWHIRVTYSRPNDRGVLVEHTEQKTVTAQNEIDAWAKFCDAIRVWPSPQNCEREIKQGEQVS